MTRLSVIPEQKIKNLPKFISIPLEKTLQEENKVRRLHLLVYSYKQIIHFISICFVCDYLNSNIKNDEIDQLLGGLKKPLLGYWVKISQALPVLLSKYKELFIPEWLESLVILENKKYEHCVNYDLGTPRLSLSGIEAFLRLRNSLSHGALPPDEKLSETLYFHYLPILIDIIDNIQFFNKFQLFFQFQNKNFNSKIVIKEIFLLRLYDSVKLELYPFIIHTSAVESNEFSIDNENFLLYESINDKTAYYVGIEEKYEVRTSIHDINACLFERKRTCIAFWEKSFFELIKNFTLKNISNTKFFKYAHIVYQEREKYTSVLKDFVYDINTKKTCLLFVSESGVGKTSLICDFFLNHLAYNYSGPLPLLIFATNLSQVNINNVVYEYGTLGQLGNYIKKLLNFEESISDWPSLVRAIETKIENKLEHYPRQLILCLDGINEAPNPFHLLQEFDYVVKLARSIQWLTCIGTIRKASFEIFLTKFKEWGIQWPQSSRSYVQDNSSHNNFVAGYFLDKFSINESYFAYLRYQEISISDKKIPASISSYQSLSMAIRQMIRHPLILDFLMHIYNNRNIPTNLAPIDLYDEFHNCYLDSCQSEVIIKLAAHSLSLNQSDFSLLDLQNTLRTQVSKVFNLERISTRNFLQYYLDLGFITEKDENRYKFTHQLYFEYLIFKNYCNLKLTTKNLIEKIINIFECTNLHLDEDINATQLLLLSRVLGNDQEIISSLSLLATYELFTKFLTPIIYELQKVNASIYNNILKSVLISKDKKLLMSFYQIYQILCDRDSQSVVLNHLLKIVNDRSEKATIELKRVRLLMAMNRNDEAKASMNMLRLYAEETKCEKLLLDIYSEEGYFDFLQGNSVSSLIAYEKANLILLKLKSFLEEEDFLKRQRDIYAGIGCSQHNLDNNEACLNSHSKSLLIDKQLDNKSSIALDLVNMADALWGSHEYGKALSTYEEAIEISKKTCYQDALNVALIGRGMVLWSIGFFQDSLDSVNSGLEISSKMSYSWDLSYGLVYKSNIQTSLKNSDSIKTNKKALALAQRFGAQYLIALSNAYLFWKYEIRQPGLISNLNRINEELMKCQLLKMHGIEIMILTVKILNEAIRMEISDSILDSDITILLSKLNSNSLIKGPWERMALKLIQVIQVNRPNINLTDFIDIVDEICDCKANSLEQSYRSIYTKSLEHSVGL